MRVYLIETTANGRRQRIDLRPRPGERNVTAEFVPILIDTGIFNIWQVRIRLEVGDIALRDCCCRSLQPATCLDDTLTL